MEELDRYNEASVAYGYAYGRKKDIVNNYWGVAYEIFWQ